jgi:GMP synthase-like glutamine amidotransferase
VAIAARRRRAPLRTDRGGAPLLWAAMKTVQIVRHVAHEGPGHLADVLERRGVPYEIARLDAGDPLPEKLDRTAGLVFMGGPMSANDPLPWIEPALDLIRSAVAQDVPVLGHCLGAQLMARALGAQVSRNPVAEIGWLPVRVVTGPASQSWLPGLRGELEVYHWHGETFSLPPGSARLLESAACTNQAFALGKHLGLQCHVEMKPALIAEWIAKSDTPLVPSATVQSAEQMLRDVERRTAALQRVADVLYDRWLQGLV